MDPSAEGLRASRADPLELPRMSVPTTSMQALRTLRQRGSVVLGVIAMACGYGLAVWSLVGGEPSVVFIGAMLIVGGSGWAFFVRPAVVISLYGVHVHNPLRRTLIPWNRLVDVGTRWNLELYHGEKHTAAWAIASHVERQRGTGMLGMMSGRRMTAAPEAGPPPSKGVTVQSAAASVELAREEWVEMVTDRRPEVSADGEVERSWDLADLAVLGVPVLVVVAGIVL